MAEAENAKEIEPATAADGQQQQQAGGIRQRIRGLLKRKDRQKQQKERPDDAVKLGCGGLFRRKKRAEAGDQESQKPAEKPKKSGKGGEVKIEQGPHTEIWSSIINKSFIGTGAFKRAAVCSLESGAVLACNPADFTPTVQQVAALRENFDCRSGLSAAGFGVADTVYSLLDEAGTKDILCGSDESRGQTLLVCKTKTALLAAACQGAPDRAADMLGDMRQHFISQGM
ncbi:hypothetical protein BOX15_Mlig020979g1 [Macrostomum lignano]|uniref:Profilin n=1 Tax=Macrostomum lignano TaxID=282301 RepID=A0A267EY07_9PLAT|nr:hypothetical protein BOX15_Mlig020979g1 [Macrostomum lignano]